MAKLKLSSALVFLGSAWPHARPVFLGLISHRIRAAREVLPRLQNRGGFNSVNRAYENGRYARMAQVRAPRRAQAMHRLIVAGAAPAASHSRSPRFFQGSLAIPVARSDKSLARLNK